MKTVSVSTSSGATASQQTTLPFTLTVAAGSTSPYPTSSWTGTAVQSVGVTLVAQTTTPGSNGSYQGTVTINFWPGSTLGAGQYSGTVALSFCSAGSSTCGADLSASISAALTVSGTLGSATAPGFTPATLDVEGAVTDVSPVVTTFQLMLSQPSPPVFLSLAQPTAQWVSALAYNSAGISGGIASLTLAPASQLAVGIHPGTVSVNACLDPACLHPLRNSPVQLPIIYRVTPLAQLSRWYQGGFAGKKVVVWGNSTVANALYFFQQFNTHTQAGAALAGLSSANVLNYGNDGASLAALLSGLGPYPMAAVIAAHPDLLIMRGPLINDVRLGQTDLAQAEQLLTQALDQITSGSPNTDILLTSENSLLTTDVNGYGYVQPNSAAQQYTDILHQAVLAMSGRYPHVAVYDIMALEYGTVSPASSPLMADQLHPNQAGQAEEADLDVKMTGLPLLTN